ncbi:hypothetical protein [Halorhabdus amylolytica]|uniref:hypothetical protein n=1 Tax=Halorhabdus amylolytica TaxID=2559573 RepID=UPI0010AB4308|nr:hypothetical protein [Halorhabdus amylolytica]
MTSAKLFVTKRAKSVASEVDTAGNDRDGAEPDPEFGSVESIRETTEAAIDEITAPDGDQECLHCGLSLPAAGPPVCHRCGVAR